MSSKIKNLFFQNLSLRQTIVKNVFWLTASHIAGRFIRAIFIIYAARILGATEYGIFSYALGLAGFFTIFADIGITQILIKEASQKPERASFYFATSFWIKTILLLVTILAVIFIAPYFSKIEAAKTIIPFVALLVIFDNLREFCNGFFRAKEKMELEALVNILMNIAIASIGFIVIYFHQTAKAITFSYIGSAGVGFLIALFILRKEFAKIITNFDKNLIQPLIKSAWPIALSGLLGAFMLNVDIIMLGWFRSAQEIGFYSASQKIIQLLYTLPAIIATAFFPVLSRLIGNQEHQRTSLIMEKGMVLIFAIAFPLTFGGIILGQPIIKFLYGQEYLPATLTFQILITTTLLMFPLTLLGNLVLAYNRQKKLALFSGVASLSNIIFNALLIPPFGIAGAAIATLLVQTIYTFSIWNMIKKINPLKTIPHLKKIFIATFFMGIATFFLNKLGLPVLINILISGILYLGFLFLLKEEVLKEGKKVITMIK